MSEPGWIRDPRNPGFERYFDGTNWTDRSRVAQAQPQARAGSGGGNGLRVLFVVLGAVVVAVIASMTWFAVTSAHGLAGEAATAATGAPAGANTAALLQDIGGLQVAVTTLLVEDQTVLPTVTFSNGEYVVTGGGSSQFVPASEAAVAAGVDVRSQDQPCVWVRGADGTVVHATASTGPAVGSC